MVLSNEPMKPLNKTTDSFVSLCMYFEPTHHQDLIQRDILLLTARSCTSLARHISLLHTRKSATESRVRRKRKCQKKTYGGNKTRYEFVCGHVGGGLPKFHNSFARLLGKLRYKQVTQILFPQVQIGTSGW